MGGKKNFCCMRAATVEWKQAAGFDHLLCQFSSPFTAVNFRRAGFRPPAPTRFDQREFVRGQQAQFWQLVCNPAQCCPAITKPDPPSTASALRWTARGLSLCRRRVPAGIRAHQAPFFTTLAAEGDSASPTLQPPNTGSRPTFSHRNRNS